MNCPSCGHVNEKNRFCVHCGTPLQAVQPQSEADAASYLSEEQQAQPARDQTAATAYYAAPAAPGARPAPAVPNEHLEKAKNISKQYFAYFLQVLRYPYQTAQTVHNEQFVNGVITIVLLSLLYPLLVYIGLSKFDFASPSFGRVVIEPMIYFLVIFSLIGAVIYGVLRLSGIAADYKSVTARLGTLLIPAVLCVAATCLFFLLGMGTGLLTAIFFLGTLFLMVSVTAVILSFRKERSGGLDMLYGIIIANIASGYIFFKVLSLASNSFAVHFSNSIGSFPF